MKPQLITIEQLIKHDPFKEGREFLATCKTIEEAWKKCEEPSWMLWALSMVQPLTKTESVEIAWRCAERVLEHFEKKYPDDKKPRQAIAASKAWIKDPSAAAYAAASAASVASAYASYASYASVAVYASSASSASASASASAEKKIQCDIIRAVVRLENV